MHLNLPLITISSRMFSGTAQMVENVGTVHCLQSMTTTPVACWYQYHLCSNFYPKFEIQDYNYGKIKEVCGRCINLKFFECNKSNYYLSTTALFLVQVQHFFLFKQCNF